MKEVFEGRHHIGKSMEAFATVVSEANKSGEKIKEISREYMPGDATPNRAARTGKRTTKCIKFTLSTVPIFDTSQFLIRLKIWAI